MRKLILVTLAVLLMTACSQLPNRQASYAGPVSYINDASRKKSAIRIYFYELAMVDGREVYASSNCHYDGGGSEQVGVNACSARHAVPAGEHTLRIRAVNYLTVPFFSLFNDRYKAEGDVTVNLARGVEYFVRGEIFDDRAAVWIEDSKGNLVSRRIEAK
ncbi:hypothetical protein [Zhongshania aquimaris]|uniref:Lipoprotein n=1 Tax=Zhongshania aquimaris TaxID=2857107 RepID=A0ABS6VWK7_9GAMM|nr:hypothetical protein [Zhongshania aquimaris]MBW2942383.1 hypothetical protein [Zhongshania aquimaris]